MEIKIESIDNGFIVDLPGGAPSHDDPLAQRGLMPQRLFAHDTIDLIGRISEYLQQRYERKTR